MLKTSLRCIVTLSLLVCVSAQARSAKLIDIDLFKADIHNVLRLFADVSGLNVVVADGVRGTVTIKLKRVPWRRALRAILKVRGLEMVQDGNILRVLPRAELEKEREAQLTERQQCLQSAPLTTRYYRLSYADASRISALLQAQLSPRGKISVDSRTNTVIVRDVRCD